MTRDEIPEHERCNGCDGWGWFLFPEDKPEEKCWVCLEHPGRRRPIKEQS